MKKMFFFVCGIICTQNSSSFLFSKNCCTRYDKKIKIIVKMQSNSRYKIANLLFLSFKNPLTFQEERKVI